MTVLKRERESVTRWAIIHEPFWVALSIVQVMSTTVTTPDPDELCAYCESRIFDHDPICVRDCDDDCGSPEYLCNYACLSAYIEGNSLTTGNACVWNPDESDCC